MQRFAPERLLQHRQQSGLRRELVAVRLDRSAAAVLLWETGKTTPNAAQLAILADLFECDPGEFFEVDQ